MISFRKSAFLGASFVLLSGVQLAPDDPLGLSLLATAQAVVGAPLTPVSVSGVARRTAVRTSAAAASSASSSATTSQQQEVAAQQQEVAAQQQQVAAQQQEVAAQQQATAQQQSSPPPADTGQPLPLGTVVPALPSGCSETAVGGVQYYKCGANYYRAVFQGDKLVYVTAQP